MKRKPAEVFTGEARWIEFVGDRPVLRQENDCEVLVNKTWSTIRLPGGERRRVKTKSWDFRFFAGQQQLF